MSLVRQIALASALAVSGIGTVLSLTGVAGAETGREIPLSAEANSAPPGITCCAGDPPSAASLGKSGRGGADAPPFAPIAVYADLWKPPGAVFKAPGAYLANTQCTPGQGGVC